MEKTRAAKMRRFAGGKAWVRIIGEAAKDPLRKKTLSLRSNSAQKGSNSHAFWQLFTCNGTKSHQQIVNTKFTLPVCWVCSPAAGRARPSIGT
ncbi:MAG: hypothetical protein IV091_00195 [Polaromonas sp.]|nr:hypothetical protein [Polaromonas sp.]